MSVRRQEIPGDYTSGKARIRGTRGGIRRLSKSEQEYFAWLEAKRAVEGKR